MNRQGMNRRGPSRLWSAALAALLCLAMAPVAGAAEGGGEEAAGAEQAAKKRTRKASKRAEKPGKQSKKPGKRSKKPKKPKKPKQPTEIPVDIGVGPAFHWITGPIQDDQAPHYGLKLSVAAILDQQTIQANKGRIPKEYRGLAGNVSEARVSPSIFIPDTLYISPKTDKVGLYGINWRPLALTLPLIRKPRLAIGLGLDLSYIFIDGEDAGLGTTHFLRIGLDLRGELEIPLSDSFLISAGWQSMFFPPQELGGEIFAWGELDESIWHLGQAFVMLHFRFPYRQ